MKRNTHSRLMKMMVWSILLCLLNLPAAFSQHVKIRNIIQAPVAHMDKYIPPDATLKQLYFPMDFGDSLFLDDAQLRKLKGKEILFIDVVYTDYPRGADLTQLNTNRLEQLAARRPGFFKNPAIQWRVVCQHKFGSKHAASQLFHGIVVSYRNDQSMIKSNIEIAYLDSAIMNKDRFPDTVVSKVLNRNEWRDMLIVADVTGSMYPYSAQFLLWLRLHLDGNTVRQMIFFNDGDMKPDKAKETGNTGGIYPIRSNSYEEVETFVKKVMSRGSGGDAQENDIEAILKGMSLCKDCDNIVLIADNQAPVRDLVLLKQVKKPVKVILCGTAGGINPIFLDIARVTGGSVHTMTSDLDNLVTMKEGDSITIAGQTFKIEKGRFVKLSGV